MISPIRSFQIATRIEFGRGAALTVGDEVKRAGGRHALLVTGKHVTAAGLLDPIKRVLEDAGVAITVFYQLRPDPTTHNVRDAADIYLSSGCDTLIAVGGGSPVDVAKGARALISNGGELQEYRPVGDRAFEKMGPPLIVIPTTSGTGTEVSPAVVITYEEGNTKVGFFGPPLGTSVALLDPEMTKTMPQGLTATCGLDALSHGIERFTSTDATPMNDYLALGAIKMVAENLRQAYANPNNMEARENLMWAGLMGGMSRSKISAAHIIAAAVGHYVDIPHGAACGTLQAPAMEFNLISNPQKFATIAEAMGEKIDGLPVMDAAYRSVEAVRRLLKDVGVTKRLRDYGLREEQIPEVAETCINVRGKDLHAQNPRVITAADIEAIIRQVY